MARVLPIPWIRCHWVYKSRNRLRGCSMWTIKQDKIQSSARVKAIWCQDFQQSPQVGQNAWQKVQNSHSINMAPNMRLEAGANSNSNKSILNGDYFTSGDAVELRTTNACHIACITVLLKNLTWGLHTRDLYLNVQLHQIDLLILRTILSPATRRPSPLFPPGGLVTFWI